MGSYDVIVAGGGPAGSACATLCAKAGLRTLLLEKSRFPREKVCGDCLNPGCWPIFKRLGIAERVSSLPHARLETVTFAGADETFLGVPLPAGRQEIAVKRSILDQLLLARAAECGAEVREESTVKAIERRSGGETSKLQWHVVTSEGEFESRWLVAADGRNSTVTRLLGMMPKSQPDRVAMQTHFPLPASQVGQVTMRFLPLGYCGLADVGENTANLCLVGRPGNITELKSWATARFELPAEQRWRTITPLSRAPISPAHDGLLLIGDAARVVEPFTGEGIFYALATGELAARHLVGNDSRGYARAHSRIYRGRLWINELARFACLHPAFANAALRFSRACPPALRLLTRAVVQAGSSDSVLPSS